jgi:hypothetical protein
MDTPVDTKISKRGQKSSSNLPDDLAEIVTVWPELPKHIKAAIRALVQTYIKEQKQ